MPGLIDILINAAGNVLGTAILSTVAWLRGIAGWMWRRHCGESSEDAGRPAIPPIGSKIATSAERKVAKPERAADYHLMRKPAAFFARRFAEAFPGCRGLCEIDNPRQALHRLDILLRDPLTATFHDPGIGQWTAQPVWWFRGSSNLAIEKYRRRGLPLIRSRAFCLNEVEQYRLRRIIAVGHSSYYRSFVYVEVDPMPPTGLYPVDIKRYIREFGYAWEEYGEYGRLWRRYVPRGEHEDGATVVRGRVRNLAGRVNLKIRYLSRYNFIIAPNESTINNGDTDDAIEDLMNGILRGEASVDELVAFAFKLPKHRR